MVKGVFRGLVLGALAFLSACSEPVSRNDTSRILAMGDSLMAWHGTSRHSIPHAIENELGESVINRSVVGAQMIYELPISGALGMKIAKQYRPGNWDWVVLNGGGNDLWLGCGCLRCDGRIERLISADGQRGEIPNLVRRLRSGGAQVIYVGYLRSPGVGSIIEHCRDDGDELERRIARLDQSDGGFHFLSLAGLVPPGDRSFHAADMIHPSIKGSAAIGRGIARIISQSGKEQG